MSTESFSPRPAFSAIDYAQIESQLDALLAEARATIARVSDAVGQGGDTGWHDVAQPLAEANNRIDLFWSPVSHLNAVLNSDTLREVYKRCLPKLTQYNTEYGQNEDLYRAFRALRDSAAFASLDAGRRRAVDLELRDFELAGVALPPAGKARYAEIQTELSRLETEFSDNVLDATNAWSKSLDTADTLAGLPSSSMALSRQLAEAKGQGGYLVNLEFPMVMAVLTFADDRDLRREVYTAWNTRASDQGPNADRFDNRARIDAILRLRAEKAALLGHADFATLSMVPKMVESPGQVLDFLDDLARRAVPLARAEYAALGDWAREQLRLKDLQVWDVAWVSEKLRKQRFDISDEDLKPYFPASRVLPGLFEVVSRLFGVRIEAVDGADVYHPDVRLYAIRDGEGRLRGEFYLDMYAREHKRGGAWMGVCATRQCVGERLQLPIAYLVCNLTPPVGEAPALLTHMEVTTLFHEFGHGLHHMLTLMDAPGVSGIAGVEWDAVELPSQFLENWCWERESLDLISAHYESGEPMPDALLQRLREARNFQSAMQLVRQLEFALFDMRVHLESTAEKAADVQGVLDAVRKRVAALDYPDWNRFQCAFSHIFAGGYSAGYFSYKWAEVLSADAFARFEEEGIFNTGTGRDFLSAVLEAGASRDAMSNFVAFRGREPSVEALLRHSGLDVAA